jgi:hypothetical protein
VTHPITTYSVRIYIFSAPDLCPIPHRHLIRIISERAKRPDGLLKERNGDESICKNADVSDAACSRIIWNGVIKRNSVVTKN